ncbi:MAG: phosphoenolpyruvate--protein phosphotransferase [Pseudomonadota bacterium]
MLPRLRRIVLDVDEADSFRAALEIIVQGVCEALGTEVASIYLRDPQRSAFVFAATEGLNTELVGRFAMPEDDGLIGLVARRAEPINLQDAMAHPAFHFVEAIGEEPFGAFLGVPIIHHRTVLGVLVVQQRAQRRFDEAEESFLVTLAAQVAAAINHARATGELRTVMGAASRQPDRILAGIAGSPGIAIGQAVVVSQVANLDAVPDRAIDDVDPELRLFDRAIEAVRGDIQRISEEFSGSLPPEELALFDAYLHMLDDSAIAGDVRRYIHQRQWAQGALRQVIREHLRRFESMEDSYLRERGSDVRDLGIRVLSYLQDIKTRRVHFPADTILVGDDVTPSLLANVPAERLKAIVSLRGSRNSHVSILARALGIPAVMGAVDLPLLRLDGERLIVDGNYGEVTLDPSPVRLAEYDLLLKEEEAFSQELEALREQPCITLDGQRVRLWVNIGLTGDISRSLDRGAEGIGLFRTEIPFMTQEQFPSEAEQRAVYRKHMEAFEPRPVTMRTLDIGGDKSLPYFPIHEENPFLGWRGIRVTLDHPEIFMVQVRAMLAANAGLDGVLRIMLPMVSSVHEIDEAKALVDRALREVNEEGATVKPPQLGVMIEVPAAVYQADLLAKRTDFLAVGSNDLTQYMLAVDRNNPRVAPLYQDLHPAVLNALREVGRAAHRQAKPVGICGELASTPTGAVLLMAMGYDVLSMNATHLPRIKWILQRISRTGGRRLLARVLKMQTAEEVHAFMLRELHGLGLSRALPRPVTELANGEPLSRTA